MITLKDFLMGRDVRDPLTKEQQANADNIVSKLEKLEQAYGKALILTSGYRPASINQYVPGAVRGDAHESCQAADLSDAAGHLSNWLMANLNILEELGFWMESPQSAKNHVHLQTRPPKSGKRVFIA